jgi:gliding motility-associated-like protein
VYLSYSESECESQRVAVRINKGESDQFPIRPNAFTPNVDGPNKLWYCESRNNLVLQVFDRWGQIIHEDFGNRVTWNGGAWMSGSYPYLLSMETCRGEVKNISGIIHLIR